MLPLPRSPAERGRCPAAEQPRPPPTPKASWRRKSCRCRAGPRGGIAPSRELLPRRRGAPRPPARRLREARGLVFSHQGCFLCLVFLFAFPPSPPSRCVRNERWLCVRQDLERERVKYIFFSFPLREKSDFGGVRRSPAGSGGDVPLPVPIPGRGATSGRREPRPGKRGPARPPRPGAASPLRPPAGPPTPIPPRP